MTTSHISKDKSTNIERSAWNLRGEFNPHSTQQFTIAFYMKKIHNNAGGRLLYLGNILYIRGNSVAGSVSWMGNPKPDEYGTNEDLGAPSIFSSWTHIAITRDNDDLNVYFDSVLQYSWTYAGCDTTAGNEDDCTRFLMFGTGENDGDTQINFRGSIDDLRIYDRVLSASELAQLAAQTHCICKH